MNKNVAIVIPVYKELPDSYEQKSLEQCFKLLYKYPITVVCPHSFSLDFYEKTAHKYSVQLSVVSFSGHYFENTRGYNKLMLSENFYKQFSAYEYILIHQLDAWIIKDEISDWVKKKYDNVGAPWLSFKSKKIAKYSGNGGLCLRNVQSSLNTLASSRILFTPHILWMIFKNLPLNYMWKYKYILKLIFPFFIKASDFIEFFSITMNEDKFWAKFAPYINKDFKSCLGKNAISFAFDTQPEFFFKLNNNKLPLGLHGWYRQDRISFWETYVNVNYDNH